MQRSAGLIIVDGSGATARMLCLRIYANYDLPKGKIEDGETPIAAALRESHEEVSIKNVEFPWGYESFNVEKPGRHSKQVTLFIGTSKDKPELIRNPDTGHYEHHAYSWLSFDDAEKKLHSYLRPAVAWAKSVIGVR